MFACTFATSIRSTRPTCMRTSDSAGSRAAKAIGPTRAMVVSAGLASTTRQRLSGPRTLPKERPGFQCEATTVNCRARSEIDPMVAIAENGGRGRESNPRRTARRPHLALKASRITGCAPLPLKRSYSVSPPEVKVAPPG